MRRTLEVTFTPADFAAFKNRDLSNAVCVVFDVLRATSSMLMALANGAEAILPVSEIAEAVALKQQRPELLLAGEREGLRIRAAQTGSIDFDLGNSPREFTADKVRGKRIGMTTTNGTRALQACRGAKKTFASSFANLDAVGRWLNNNKPEHLILVCAGTFEEAAYEDTMGAGALADLVWETYKEGHVTDSAQMARRIFLSGDPDPLLAVHPSRNARRLLANPDLSDDVAVSLQRNTIHFLAVFENNEVRKVD